MQFHAKADVYTASGDKAGVLDRVVIDPRNQAVTHVIIKKGLLFPSDKVVPVSLVAEADKDRVVLNADAGNPENLPDFTQEQYVPLNSDEWATPPMAGGAIAPMTAGAATAPMMLWYPATAAGSTGAQLASDIGASPGVPGVPGSQQVEAGRNIPEDTVPLKEGAKVVTADGQHVGKVERVFVDNESTQATHLLISQGLFLRERKVIPVAWVLDYGEDEVRLAIGSNLLQGLRPYTE